MKILLMCNPQNHKKMRRSLLPFGTLWGIGFIFSVFLSACSKDYENTTTPPTNKSPNLQLVTDGLVAPLSVSEAPDDSKRLFIVDQVGKIWIVGADGVRLTTAFIDLGSKIVGLSTGYDERGLLGLAFHPSYKTNGKFYVF